MKPTFLFVMLMLASCIAQSQDNPEFRTNSNGLMYSDTAMMKLRQMVTDQNIRFKTCDLNKRFISYPQARVFSVTFKSKRDNLKAIRSAMDKGEPFYTLVADHNPLIESIDTNQIFIQLNPDEEGKITYLKGNPEEGYSSDYMLSSNKSIPEPNHWIYDYDTPDKYDKEYRLSANWFLESFRQTVIPAEYGKLIQYVDCMIDTNAQVFLTDKYSGRYFDDEQEDKKKLSESFDYVQKKAKEACTSINEGYGYSDSLVRFAAKQLASDPVLIGLVQTEAQRCVEEKKSDVFLEDLAGKLGLKKEELQLMRCRRVMGMCSQDQSPRYHAVEIATLAGEVQQWDIFMRAHMDILNDRFERMIDGSYAWEARQTYLKELEELDLNVVDMMLGMALRAANTSENHYTGTVWRLGKAMVESKDRKNFEQRVTEMMFDTSLDEFNRGLAFLLLSSYIRRLPDITEANELIESLKHSKHLQPGTGIANAVMNMKTRSQKKKED